MAAMTRTMAGRDAAGGPSASGASKRRLPVHRRPALFVVVLAMVALSCSPGGEDRRSGDGGADRRDRDTSSTSGDVAPPPPPLMGGVDDPSAVLPLGSYSSLGQGSTCLPGATDCLAFEVECPGLRRAGRGEIDIREATGPDQGVLVIFAGAGGGSWFREDHPGGDAFLVELAERGFTVVQVAWRRGSWLVAASGEEAGTASVACRPATVLSWLHENVYLPLGIDNEPLQCGFCVTGNSGGASQATYPLAFYGLDDIIDVVVATSGPPHAAQDKGCLRNPSEEAYWYDSPSQEVRVDSSYGFREEADGPCARNDESWAERWRMDSLATGGADYNHPLTRLHFILGGRDTTPAPAQAEDYIASLRQAGSPHVSVEIEPSMPHALNDAGLERLRMALLG